MGRRHRFLAVALFGLLAAPAHAQEQSASPAQPQVRAVRVAGAKELSEADLLSFLQVRVGERLPQAPDDLAKALQQRYREDGYTFVDVKASFDEPSAALTLTIDEGIIDRVEFVGVGDPMARTFADEFALRGGDIFQRTRAMSALEVLLRPTRGAVRPGGLASRFGLDPPGVRSTFDRIDRNGERILLVGLAEPPGRVRVVPDLGDREDWFTPVDGFVPSLGFGVAVFDHRRYNHAYIAGHLSYKAASHQGGYALGFEKPFFSSAKLFAGAEVFGLTATDDGWRVSPTEASLAAIGPRRSYRDYYRRRGVQVNGALRPHRQVELLFAWRAEQHDALANRTDFSVWNGDEAFRPNLVADSGRLDALVVGAIVDSQGFEGESLDASYRRHQLENAYGARLLEMEEGSFRRAWRIDWTSEIASPDRFGGDFDFRRHIVTGKARLSFVPHEELAVRAIGGWSDGVLPPQRQFALGGIGSVHGYDFKEAVGDTLALLNVEYGIGQQKGAKVVGFFDAGRTTSLLNPDAPWLRGAGFGVGFESVRLDFGFPLTGDRHPMQVLLRFSRTF